MKRESRNTLLKRTVMSLLSQQPMRRKELYPLIQAVHPDLCDDSHRRASKGIDYGPAWKAWVGSALDNLKKEGRIVPAPFKGGAWRPVDNDRDFREDHEKALRKVDAARSNMNEQIDRLEEHLENAETRLDRLETEIVDLKTALLVGCALLQQKLTSKIGGKLDL